MAPFALRQTQRRHTVRALRRMYRPHEHFEGPNDPNVRIWHYMDLFKFLALLDTSKLYFARLDTLEDPFEGAFPSDPASPDTETMPFQHIRRSVFASCWHMSPHESAAMWKIYSHAGHGIAIQSTFARLSGAFSEERPDVHIGAVRYRDYACEAIAPDDALACALSKRKSFEYERELRAAVLHEEHDPPSGISVPVDLDRLIEHIYLSPALTEWQEETLLSLLKRFRVEKLLKKSELGFFPSRNG